MTSPSVIFVLGPTASGKSKLALHWAQKTGGVVLNCDSVQTYTLTDIGTAKPTLEERKLAPHLLFDFVVPPLEMTAGIFRELAR
ncbi:MAG: tRNA (adenosine(37)-N6)-dimethylallyltransferase MiaA, partial [Bdellovibrionales bacterium]|nr:tRNA (adenosine(37)-N6)-dimethylallyltransferase MiaA [Bdellovibrionales bacterium]